MARHLHPSVVTRKPIDPSETLVGIPGMEKQQPSQAEGHGGRYLSQLPRMTLPPMLLTLNNMTGSFKESPQVSEQVRLRAAVENRKKSISQEDQPPVQEGRGAQRARALFFAKTPKRSNRNL